MFLAVDSHYLIGDDDGGGSMSPWPSSFRSLAAAAASASASTANTSYVSMAYRPYFRGGRLRDGRYFSDGASHPNSGNNVEFLSGDSHFGAISDANRSFRPSFRAGSSQDYFRNNRQHRPQQMSQLWSPRSTRPPDYRLWEYAKPGPPPDWERFTVLSYNILADYLATGHGHLYFHVPRYIMDWNWRKKNIIFELGLWSSDILCFQEVDKFQDILEELKPRGYNGIWKMRTGDAADGCAVFWRVSRFKLLHEESINYNKHGLRDNVAQICVLESLNGQSTASSVTPPSASSERSNRVVVCNVHVLFNPKRGDIKLGQIRVLLDRAHSVSKLWDDAPVVICGDFNSTPMSPIYDFITKQKLDLSTLARDEVSGQKVAEARSWTSARNAGNFFGAPTNNSEKAELDSPLNVPVVQEYSTEVVSSSHVEVSLSVSDANENHDKLIYNSTSSCTSVCFDIPMAEKSSLVVDGGTDEFREDSDSFLSDLHDAGEGPCPDDLSSSSRLNVENEMSIGALRRLDWTPAEIEAATGDADCKIVEHPLKLSSAYAEVENSSGIRDSCGEPLVTSYHRRFCGTVDYIWLSEGLRAAKVLAPIPKNVMTQTPGFPTKKWGSDHIALVSELAFTRDR